MLKHSLSSSWNQYIGPPFSLETLKSTSSLGTRFSNLMISSGWTGSVIADNGWNRCSSYTGSWTLFSSWTLQPRILSFEVTENYESNVYVLFLSFYKIIDSNLTWGGGIVIEGVVHIFRYHFPNGYVSLRRREGAFGLMMSFCNEFLQFSSSFSTKIFKISRTI